MRVRGSIFWNFHRIVWLIICSEDPTVPISTYSGLFILPKSVANNQLKIESISFKTQLASLNEL